MKYRTILTHLNRKSSFILYKYVYHIYICDMPFLSDFYRISGADVPEIFHGLLHKRILLFARAMAGVIDRGISVQRFCDSGEGLIRRPFGQMEPAE